MNLVKSISIIIEKSLILQENVQSIDILLVNLLDKFIGRSEA